MNSKHAETINGVRVPYSGACWNPDKPLQQLTLSVAKIKFMDSGFRRSDAGSLWPYKASTRQHFILLVALRIPRESQ
jgi:hypothetical protein